MCVCEVVMLYSFARKFHATPSFPPTPSDMGPFDHTLWEESYAALYTAVALVTIGK